jgi:hypothetical protein
VRWWLMLLHDTSCLFQMLVPTHHRSINWCCLVQKHMIKFASDVSVGYQLCLPQNAIHFLAHGKHPFIWNKTDVPIDDDLDQLGKKRESYHTKWSITQFNVSFHFWNIMVYFIAIQGWTPLLRWILLKWGLIMWVYQTGPGFVPIY